MPANINSIVLLEKETNIINAYPNVTKDDLRLDLPGHFLTFIRIECAEIVCTSGLE